MKAIKVPNGILHIGESKAFCPYCTRQVSLEESEPVIQNSKNGFGKMNCKGCKRKIGITSNIMGDTVAYELK